MLRRFIWSMWAIVPVFLMAFHFGPGQPAWERDQAVSLLAEAREAEQRATDAQAAAHALNLHTIEVRKQALLSDDPGDVHAVELALATEKDAYSIASDLWQDTAERYLAAELLLGDTPEAEEVRWAKARAMVRAGSVWRGIAEFHSLMDRMVAEDRLDTTLALATREELAAAHYYATRILREEGRPEAQWREMSSVARQQYRYLAERALAQDETDLADSLQKNLERVLDLEQLDSSELFAEPLPRESPRGRRPGDGPPRRGRGPRPGQNGNGAGPLMEIGPGW